MIGSWDKLGYVAFNLAATKSSKDARQVGLSWHGKRCEVREKSTEGKYFRSSLQCLDNNEICYCWSLICIGQKQGTRTNCTVRRLRAVQEHLMHGYGYLHLEEAYNLYSSFSGEGEGVISDHKYSGHNNSVRVEFLADKESSARLFGLLMKEKVFSVFVSIIICFNNYNI